MHPATDGVGPGTPLLCGNQATGADTTLFSEERGVEASGRRKSPLDPCRLVRQVKQFCG
jgi:hypothetical protein